MLISHYLHVYKHEEREKEELCRRETGFKLIGFITFSFVQKMYFAYHTVHFLTFEGNKC